MPLFVYGTLQLPEVVRAVTGRVFPGMPAILEGYRRGRLRDRTYPGLVLDPACRTAGLLLLDMDPDILERLDRFEGEVYHRQTVQVTTGSGEAMPAFTYVIPPEDRHLLVEAWDLEHFRREDLAGFLSGYRGFEE